MLLLLFAGCADVMIEVETATCTNIDFMNPEQSALEAEILGDSEAIVARTWVTSGCYDVFAPEVEAQGRRVEIRERWESLTEDDCELCFSPEVRISGAPSSLEVVWYIEDDAEPFGVLELEL